MKKKVEIFFDYICPYCFKAHEQLNKLIKEYDDIEIIWCPCEINPRSQAYCMHSDLCIQGYFFAQDSNADLFLYNDRMYKAVHIDRIDIENIDILSDYVRDIVNASEVKKAISDGRYTEKLKKANEYAFVDSKVWAVPSYRNKENKLDAVEGIGITQEQLKSFLDNCK